MVLKKNQRRPCPALGREITAGECVADRHRGIACTADCPSNPFAAANHAAFRELENAVQAKCRDRLRQRMPPARRSTFLPQGQAGRHDILKSHDWFQQELFCRKDAQGLTFFDQWEAEDWQGLDNDEQTYLRGHRQMRPRLLERQCLLDAGRFQVIDLLDPGSAPFILVDRSGAGGARRFLTTLSWVFPTPHDHRPNGPAIPLGPIGPCDSLEAFMEIMQHLGGPSGPDGTQEWLLHHFRLVADAMHAVTQERQAESRRLMEKTPRSAPRLIRGSSQAQSGYRENLPLTSGGEQDGPWDPSLVPPRLLERPLVWQPPTRCRAPFPPQAGDQGEQGESPELRCARDRLRHYLDAPLLELHGLTPRAASSEPALRPALIRLMKQQVTAVDEMRCARGMDVDINDQLAELGLHEIIFPPPPLAELDPAPGAPPKPGRAAPAAAPHVSLESMMARFSHAERKAFAAPAPLRAVLNGHDIDKRMEAMMLKFRKPDRLLHAYESDWAPLAGALDDLTSGLLDSAEYETLTTLAIHLVQQLFPDGPPSTPINPRRLTWYFFSELKAAARLKNLNNKTQDSIDFMQDSPQPHLVTALCSSLLLLVDSGEGPLTEEGALNMVPILKALVRELCQLPLH